MQPNEPSRAQPRAAHPDPTRPLVHHPVESVETITVEGFAARHVRANRPLLVRGAVADWPAITRWTNGYLRARLGRCRIDVETSPDQFEGRVFDDTLPIQMRFGAFLDRLDQPEGRYDYYVDPWLRPELLPDIAPHPLFEAFGPFYRRRLIMTRGGNRIAWHSDWYENVIAQITGRKHLVLCAPEESPCLRPLDSTKVNYSALDQRRPDRERFPDLDRVTFYEARLAPGDLLYVPTHWWHTVASFERNIMISWAFNERDETLCDIIRRLFEAGHHRIEPHHVAEVTRLLDADGRGVIPRVGRYARAHALYDLIRLTRQRQMIFDRE